jgi:ribosomal protein S18 acetylase RimI-like enzyme
MLHAGPNSLQRIPLEHGAEALRLAAGAWPDDERPGQLAALAKHLRSGQAQDFVLVEARRDAVLVGAALAQCLPGRVAVVWLPQVANAEAPELLSPLLAEIHAQLKAANIELAQTLVEPASDAHREVLLSAGYVHAGDLLYMAAAVKHEPSGLTPASRPEPVEFVGYTDERYDRLLRVIGATYRGSLDCPLVDGLRETADVLDGYRAVSEFRSELWLIAQAGENDIGCLLLADHPAENQLEIVYAGLVPAVRGRGWGRQLTAQAMRFAAKLGRARVVLSVDAANWPAIALYEAAGFATWDRRSVLVRSFRADASSASTTT